MWNGTSLNPASYPPFGPLTTPCVGIWYFQLSTSNCTSSCFPALCAQWSVQRNSWDDWTGGTETTGNTEPPSNCVTSDPPNLVVVGIEYHYSTLTPLHTLASGALTTYAETELLEEQ